MTKHLGWLFVLALFCATFTSIPALKGDVVGSPVVRGAFRPFYSTAEPGWRSHPAPRLSALAAQSDSVHAEFGQFIAHADPHLDMFLSVYPAYLEARDQMQQGRLPLWNEHVLSGSPLMASGMVQPANPFFWIAAFTSKWSGFMWMLFAQAFACAASFYFYFTTAGRSSAAAALAALALTFTGEVLLFFPYGTLVGGLAFVPWVLCTLERIVQRGRGEQAALVAGLAMAMAGQWLCANIQFAAYLTLLEVAWCAWQIVLAGSRGVLRSKGVLGALGGGTLGILAASCQLFPLVDLLAAGGRDPSKYAGFNKIDPALLLTVLFPQSFGDVSEGTFAGGVLLLLPPASVYMLSFGAVIWLLVVCGIARDPRGQVFWIAVTLGPPALLLAANIDAVSGILALIPGFETSHSARILIVSSIGAATMAAQGFDALLGGQRRVWRAATGFVVVQVAALAAILAFSRSSQSLFAYHLRSLPWRNFAVAAVPCLAVLAVAKVMVRQPMRTRWASVALFAVGCFELGWHVSSRLEYAKAEALYAPTPVVRELMQRSSIAPGRFVGLTERDSYPPYQGDNLPPNVGSVFGLLDVRGYVPVPTLEQELVMAMAENLERPAHFSGAIQLGNATSPWVDRLAVRYVMTTRSDVPTHYRLLHAGTPNLFENLRAAPIVSLVGCADVIEDEVRLVRHVVSAPWSGRLSLGRDAVGALGEIGAPVLNCGNSPVEVLPVVSRAVAPGEFEAEVEVPGAGGYLRIARSFGTGFKATVNGREFPVLRADYALQAVPLPPGRARIVVRYEPDGVMFGLRLSAASLFSILLLGALALTRRHRV